MSTRKKGISVYVVTYSAYYDDRSHSEEGVFTSRMLARQYIKRCAANRWKADKALFPGSLDFISPLSEYKAEYDIERFTLDAKA